jgi:hypothetical protein
MSQQGLRQQLFRDYHGTAGNHPYEADLMLAFAKDGFSTGTFNERALGWLNRYLGVTHTTLPGAEADFAVGNGFSRWGDVGSLTGGVPYLHLDFSRSSAAIDPRFTVTRAGSAWRFNPAGLLESVSANSPRIDCAPSTGAYRGLLVETSAINRLLWCRDLTNAAWTKSNTTAALDQIGIDGIANSASSLTATAGNGTCLQSITLASSARVQSCFMKRLVGTGTIEMTTDNGVTWTAVSPVVNAWTRVRIPQQTLANPIAGFRIVTSGDAVAIDIAQNETVVADIPTSPIITTSAQVTRASDLVKMPITGWYTDNAAGTFYVSAMADNEDTAGGGFRRYMSIDDGGGFTNAIYCDTSSTLSPRWTYYTSTVAQAQTTATPGTTVVNLTPWKTAVAFATNDLATVTNGGAAATDATVTLNSGLTNLRMGAIITDSNFASRVWVRVVKYWPARLTNTQMQTLTA